MSNYKKNQILKTYFNLLLDNKIEEPNVKAIRIKEDSMYVVTNFNKVYEKRIIYGKVL